MPSFTITLPDISKTTRNVLIGIGAAVGAFGLYKLSQLAAIGSSLNAEKARIKSIRDGAKKDVVYVFGMPPTKNRGFMSMPTESVLLTLRFLNISHEFVPCYDFTCSPTGRVPFVQLNGQIFTDSNFIIDKIISHFHIANKTMSQELTEAQLARGHVITRFVEDGLRMCYLRFAYVDHVRTMTDRFVECFEDGPFPEDLLRKGFAGKRQRTIAMLNEHGHGDLTDEQYLQVFFDDVRSLEALLKENTFAVENFCTRFDVKIAVYLRLLRSFPELQHDVAAIKYVIESQTIADYVAAVYAACGKN